MGSRSRVFLFVGCVVALLPLGLLLPQGSRLDNDGVDDNQMQCGHFSIKRCSELLGIPVEDGYLLRQLPPRDKGHNMMELAAILEGMGFQTQGWRTQLEDLESEALPVIAYVNPNHWIVVSDVSDSTITFYDDAGRRSVVHRKVLRETWSGMILRVSLGEGALKPSRKGAPRIRFDTLIVDRGSFAADKELAPYEFRFRNLGGGDLVIEEIKKSCSCIEAEKPKVPIPTGKEGVIRLAFSHDGDIGPFSKRVVVKTNDPDNPMLMLVASGNILAEPFMRPDELNFSDLFLGDRKCKLGTWRIQARDNEPFFVESVECLSDNLYVSCIATEETQGVIDSSGARIDGFRVGNSISLIVSVKPKELGVGEMDVTIRLRLRQGGATEIEIPIHANVVHPNKAFPDLVYLGEFEASCVSVDQVIKLKSSKEMPFTITRVRGNGFPLVAEL